jgi:hypothetical protein
MVRNRRAPMTQAASLFRYAPDAKTALVLRLLLAHIHPLDHGAARALAAELDHRVHGAGLALEDRLNGAVGPVRHPAGDSEGLGATARRVAEEDPLDATVDDDAPTDHPPAWR